MELRNVIMRFLDNRFHPFMIKNFGVDMNEFQAWVHKETPPFTLSTALQTIVLSTIFW